MQPLKVTSRFTGAARMRYELPEAGISLTGYLVRRLHKTSILENIESDPVNRLNRFAVYAVAAATSWGPAYYKPQCNGMGTTVSKIDPETGAQVRVTCTSEDPHYTFASHVEMPYGLVITGEERLNGTLFPPQGIGVSAPSAYKLSYAGYTAEAIGTIHNELVPPSTLRAHGFLTFTDSLGNTGQVEVNEQGMINVEIEKPDSPLRLRSIFQIA